MECTPSAIFFRQHQLELLIVDAGVNADLASHPRLIDAKIGKGTLNFLTHPAMTIEACTQAIQAGAELVLQQYNNGCNCIGFGEMGIGNTSSATLLMHCLTAMPLAQCVGRGTGLNDDQLQNKLTVLEQALNQHKNIAEPLERVRPPFYDRLKKQVDFIPIF
jgi:nicotinate-nucleotide--dimethylbenzimidazole phosphoribosyltransferase